MIPIGVLLVNPDSKIVTYTNKEMLNIIGKGKDQISSQNHAKNLVYDQVDINEKLQKFIMVQEVNEKMDQREAFEQGFSSNGGLGGERKI